ncbi:DUF401 family protein [Thermohalobacter berrensis]|uniref:DUF401 family protein n=1 Tax=Thermohalobacter berrensis TaxID=99594 RepID=A0A419SWA2_9FIRM|nr:DUF401 family protein [Thermohalobacter berrensis]RKD29523.1 hypothetical protein BET03_05545 [Thermohalobacter berrensis]
MVIFSLIFSMAVILFLVSKKVNIGYSLMIGAALLAILNGKKPNYILQTFIETIKEPKTITLAITIGFITILGHLMDKYGILDRMVIALEKMLGSAKITILISPAIIGTLLVTGGALMSCPVVEGLGKKLNLPEDRKAAINLIFRHGLYFIFPLSPAVILAVELGGFNVFDFIKLQFPIALTMYILGYIFYLKDCKQTNLSKFQLKEYLLSIKEFILYSSPILISLLGAILFGLPFYISLILGILSSIFLNLYDKKTDREYHVDENLFKTIREGLKLPMVIAIIGIMIFKNIVNDINEIYMYLEGLLNKGIPLEILILASSAIISFPLASTQPGVAILYPMILPLAPDYNTKLLYGMFIYTSSFMFYFISPLHLCQVLTLEYFKVKLKNLYKNYAYILPITYIVMVMIYVINNLQ